MHICLSLDSHKGSNFCSKKSSVHVCVMRFLGVCLLQIATFKKITNLTLFPHDREICSYDNLQTYGKQACPK